MDEFKSRQLAAEIADLERLLAVVQTSGVRHELQELLANRKRQSVALPVQQESCNQAPEQAQATADDASTQEPLEPVKKYISLDTFGWEDARGKEKVSVYILSGVDGVGDLPRENVTCDFGKQSFDLKIHGLNGRNFRLVRDNLEREIVVDKSSFRVKTNRVVISLWKTDKFGRWNELTAASANKPMEPKAKDQDEEEDQDDKPNPGSARVIDLMQKAYEASDETTQRSIAKTWQQRQEKEQQKAKAQAA